MLFGLRKGSGGNKLEDRLRKAREKGRDAEIVELSLQLEKERPKDPHLPHRRGDALRKLGRIPEAVAAYEIAVQKYSEQGFLTRAMAMAKTLIAVDPSRADILDNLTGGSGRTTAKALKAQTGGILEAVPHEGGDVRRVRVTAEPVEKVPLDVDEDARKLAAMPLFPLFADASEDALRAFVLESDLVEPKEGEFLIRKGDASDGLYGIVAGSVTVHIPGSDTKVSLLEGDVFGESCLLNDEPRKADVTAGEGVVVMYYPKSVLDRLTEHYPEVRESLLDLLARRLLSNLIETSPLFLAFDSDQRMGIANAFEVRRCPDQTAICEAGQTAQGLLIPLAGELHITGHDTVRPGVVLGQQSLINGGPSGVTARAIGEVIYLRLPGPAFTSIAMQYPPILEQLSMLSADEVAQL